MGCRKLAALVTGAVIAVAGWGGAAIAQTAEMQAGGVNISIGGGWGSMYAPSVRFTQSSDAALNTVRSRKNNDLDGEYGYTLGGSLSVPMTGTLYSLVLNGFYGRVDGNENSACAGSATSTCTWMNPVDGAGADKVGLDHSLRTSRDITNFGASVEGRRSIDIGRNSYLAAGFDWRAFRQDSELTGTAAGAQFRYSEQLDTNYYGAIVAYGTDYKLPFFGGLTSGWGLQSSIRLWGGVYYGQAEVDGAFSQSGAAVAAANSRLRRSADAATFIGGITTETRKRLSPNMLVSLRSDYTYYGWTPVMAYDDSDTGAAAGTSGGRNAETRIKDDHIFTMSTMLRLTIESGARMPLK